MAYMFIGGDPAYSVKYGKKIRISENIYDCEQLIRRDSIVAKILKIVDETAGEFHLEQRAGFYNTVVSERYYSFRHYELSTVARKEYEYQFLKFSTSLFVPDSMLVAEIADFPSRRQSKISKQLENAIVGKFVTTFGKDEIHRLSKR